MTSEYPSETYARALHLAVAVGKQSRCEDARAHPKVGAVIVNGGAILASAYRGELGLGDHAEFTLFGKKLRDMDVTGATLFTTLEPCTTREQHKPCAAWIIERKVARVVIGMLDPNPRIYAAGATLLREHGVEVESFPADLRDEVRLDNKAFIDQYHANPELSGYATFNYSHNDGKYTIGHGPYMFETRWSRGSDTCIHIYKDATNLRAIRLALGARSFGDLAGADIYDASSRVQTLKEGELVVLENADGHFAAVQIVDVQDRMRAEGRDALTIAFHINTDRTAVFRN